MSTKKITAKLGLDLSDKIIEEQHGHCGTIVRNRRRKSRAINANMQKRVALWALLRATEEAGKCDVNNNNNNVAVVKEEPAAIGLESWNFDHLGDLNDDYFISKDEYL